MSVCLKSSSLTASFLFSLHRGREVSLSSTLFFNCFLSLRTSQGRDRSVYLKHSSVTASFLFLLHRGRDRSICPAHSFLTASFSSHFTWGGTVFPARSSLTASFLFLLHRGRDRSVCPTHFSLNASFLLVLQRSGTSHFVQHTAL